MNNMNPTDILDPMPAAERLAKTVCQTRGLLYALSALTRRPPDENDEKLGDEPSDDEAEGLIWLARDIGNELDELANEIGDDYAKRAQAAYRAAYGEPKGGTA